jgi:hypothetical protein
MIGYWAGLLANNTSNNLFIGQGAGVSNTGNDNIFLGYVAGNGSGSNCIFIGNQIGPSGSNKLVIEGAGDDVNPLIYGEFDNNVVKLNGNVGIEKTPATDLDVAGSLRACGATWPATGAGVEIAYSGGVGYIQSYDRGTSTWKDLRLGGNVTPTANNSFSLGNSTYKWTAVWAVNGTIQTSDRRLKENISNLHYGLNDVMKLNPVSFTWKESKDKSKKLGLIAQDLQNIIPEVVSVGDDSLNTLGVNYADLIPVLINAIQEQQKIIEKMSNESIQMDSDNAALKAKIQTMESQLFDLIKKYNEVEILKADVSNMKSQIGNASLK